MRSRARFVVPAAIMLIVLLLGSFAWWQNAGSKDFGYEVASDDDGTAGLIGAANGANSGRKKRAAGGGGGGGFSLQIGLGDYLDENGQIGFGNGDQQWIFDTAFTQVAGADNGDAAYLNDGTQGYSFGGDTSDGKSLFDGKDGKDAIGEGPGGGSPGGFSGFSFPSTPFIPLRQIAGILPPTPGAPPETETPPDDEPPPPDIPDIPDFPIPEPGTALFALAILSAMGVSRRRS